MNSLILGISSAGYSIPIKSEGSTGQVKSFGGKHNGGLAQLARASALQAEGQRFESVILHEAKRNETAKREA